MAYIAVRESEDKWLKRTVARHIYVERNGSTRSHDQDAGKIARQFITQCILLTTPTRVPK